MRRRLRSTIKWSGTILTVLLLAAWLGSAWFGIKCVVHSTTSIYIAGGQAGVQVTARDPPKVDTGRRALLQSWRHPFRLRWWFSRDWSISSRMGWTVTTTYYGMPLWLCSLLALMPSSLAWYRGRRRAPGHCVKCNYDLRATTTGTCPECGADA